MAVAHGPPSLESRNYLVSSLVSTPQSICEWFGLVNTNEGPGVPDGR